MLNNGFSFQVPLATFNIAGNLNQTKLLVYKTAINTCKTKSKTNYASKQ